MLQNRFLYSHFYSNLSCFEIVVENIHIYDLSDEMRFDMAWLFYAHRNIGTATKKTLLKKYGETRQAIQWQVAKLKSYE